ncbi:MAG: hydroxymethylglutaryl-CoA reductase [Crocinitomicaceae bacterium]|nr:hydroxymethylglutaryl-CoA reductase [Crocinitomicaceae bacterium]
MSITKNKLNKVVERISLNDSINKVANFDGTATLSLKTVPHDEPFSKVGQQLRLDFLEQVTAKKSDVLAGKKVLEDYGQLKGNIENFIGMTQIPTGVLGPVVINGTQASGGFYVPMATSEGALVASYARGARACRESGAIKSVCLMEGVQRSPIFKFNDLIEVGQFVVWLMKEKEKFPDIVRATSNYAELNDMEFNIEGNQVILNLEYLTGDASGQNMVTIVSHAICRYIVENTPIKPKIWFVESNFSGDKKATSISFSSVRGKNVTAEITLKKEVINKVLKSTPELMFEYWKSSFMGAVKCGSIGAQGHFANGLAAMFIAMGQDAACVSEASVGITRMEIVDEDLYCAVTLPNLIVGTVGGGTALPTQKECLEMMDCSGSGNAIKLSEICAAVCLAGEISIIAALSADHFASAHEKLGRK